VTNTLLRTNLFNKFGPLNRYTSLGVDGFQELVHRYWSSADCFRFTDLNPVKDMARRGVDDKNLLPGYFYRDDSLKLWEIIKKTVEKLMSLFYLTPDDVINDSELKVNSFD
jgi:arachidonate 5-lipoxygenase